MCFCPQKENGGTMREKEATPVLIKGSDVPVESVE